MTILQLIFPAFPTKEGVLVYPGVLGGQNYAPDTFDPKENIVLIPGIEEPSIMKTAKNETTCKKSKPLQISLEYGHLEHLMHQMPTSKDMVRLQLSI